VEPTSAQRFREKLRNFLEANSRRLVCADADRAKFFIETKEPALAHRYLVELTEAMIRSEERKQARTRNPEDEAQLKFLGEDFAALFNSTRHLLPIAGGLRRQLHTMTITQLRQAARAIRSRVSKRASEQARYLETLAEQMSPYAQIHHKLTFGAYLELRADGIEIEAPKVAAK
jgi:hypothetical protein